MLSVASSTCVPDCWWFVAGSQHGVTNGFHPYKPTTMSCSKTLFWQICRLFNFFRFLDLHAIMCSVDIDHHYAIAAGLFIHWPCLLREQNLQVHPLHCQSISVSPALLCIFICWPLPPIVYTMCSKCTWIYEHDDERRPEHIMLLHSKVHA